MDIEDARKILVAQVQTRWGIGWSAYDLFHENQSVRPNFAEAKKLFGDLRMEVEYTRQATLGLDPVTSYHCALYLDIYIPKGAGTKTANAIQQDFSTLLNCKNNSGVVTHTPAPMKPVETKGWYVMPLRVPFHFSSIS